MTRQRRWHMSAGRAGVTMRATQFVLLYIAVAVSLTQPPALGAPQAAEPGPGCSMVAAVRC